ncbi:MAG: hypothetical protein R3Y67_07270 [Eubacteriales bacterium]
MIRYKVAFVLRLIDDYTGVCIRGIKFRFEVDGNEYRPIVKDEGLYVFLEPMASPVSVSICGNGYYECSVQVDKLALNPEEPIAEVRLYAQVRSNLPYSYETVCGKLEGFTGNRPQVVVAQRARETGIILKEVKTIEGSTYLVCNGFTKENLLGKVYTLHTGKKLDVFILTEKTGINEYKIEGKVEGKHIAGTPIKRAYRSVTDENGYYMIPVEVGEAEAITSVIPS